MVVLSVVCLIGCCDRLRAILRAGKECFLENSSRLSSNPGKASQVTDAAALF
jgi:hypothetical protein